jgi:hypothetical protein
MPTPWRDASDRLVYDFSTVTDIQYPKLCRQIADAFQLTMQSAPIIGPSEIFADFTQADLRLQLSWDIWFGFMIVAQTPESETLVADIASWLRKQLR